MTPAQTQTVPSYVLGLDLGQAQDSTGIVVVQPTADPEPIHNVRQIERVPLHTRYPAIVSHVCALVSHLRRPIEIKTPNPIFRSTFVQPEVSLVVDATGVGRPVADMLLDANSDVSALVFVTITGGDRVTRDEETGMLRVPKRDLASTIQRLLQESRLRIAQGIPMASALTSELAGFRVKVNLRGHDSYGAGEDWRSAPHDDLVLGLALASWWVENAVTVEIH